MSDRSTTSPDRNRIVERRPASVFVALLLIAAFTLSACQPEHPSAGRGTPVRRVLIVGDSMTYGLFGTTPRLHEQIVPLLADRGIETRIVGYPGSTILQPWEGQARFSDLTRMHVAAFDPDVVIVQSILFPGADDPARQQAYISEARELFAAAGARGAHVYVVGHNAPVPAKERNERDIAQYIQGVVAGPGVSRIPADWWLERCKDPFVSDGWHLSASGQQCQALAFAVAIDQLRAQNG